VNSTVIQASRSWCEHLPGKLTTAARVIKEAARLGGFREPTPNVYPVIDRLHTLAFDAGGRSHAGAWFLRAAQLLAGAAEGAWSCVKAGTWDDASIVWELIVVATELDLLASEAQAFGHRRSAEAGVAG
jgi:hypothetical protein